jgi:hypothetical protein
VFSNGLELLARAGSGHGPALLSNYREQVVEMAERAFKAYWWAYPLVLAGMAVMAARPAAFRGSGLARLAVLAVLAALAYQAWRRGWHLGGQQGARFIMQFYAAWALLLVAAIGLRPWRHIGPLRQAIAGSRRIALLALLLALLPFAGAVGTNNALPLNALLIMAPGTALLALLALLARGPVVDDVAARIALLVIGGFAASQVLSAAVTEPYRLARPIQQQTVVTPIGAASTPLKLDAATSDFFASMRRIAAEQGFRPGDDIVGLVKIPGVVYALGGRSPGIAWYIAGYPGAKEHNELGLSLAAPDRLRRAYILETTGSPEAMPDLAKLGLDFPRNYVLGGEAAWPAGAVTVRFWRPRTR